MCRKRGHYRGFFIYAHYRSAHWRVRRGIQQNDWSVSHTLTYLWRTTTISKLTATNRFPKALILLNKHEHSTFKKKIWRRCFYITVFQKESDFLQKMFDVIFILSCMQCLIKQHLWAKRCFVYSVNGETSISRTIYRGVIATTNGV